MRKTLILLATAVFAVSCIKVTPEQTIDKIYQYFSTSDGYSPVEGEFSSAEDITIGLASETKIKDIWTVDEGNGNVHVFGQIKGAKHPDKVILLTSSVQNEKGNAILIEIIKAFNKLKIKSNNTIILAFFQGKYEGMKIVAEALKDSKEQILFNLHLDGNEETQRTFILGESDRIYGKINEIITPYYEGHEVIKFIKAPEHPENWPLDVSLYRYDIDEKDIAGDAAVLSSFIFLMN